MLSRSRIGAPQEGQDERGDTIDSFRGHPVDDDVQERTDGEAQKSTQPDQQPEHADPISGAVR